MITDILLYGIPAILMILVTQFTRHTFVKKTWDGGYAICNGVRWVLILLALIPIANIVALLFEICFILAAYVENEIRLKNGNNQL